MNINIVDEHELLTLLTNWFADRGVSDFEVVVVKNAGERAHINLNIITELKEQISELDDKVDELETENSSLEFDLSSLAAENADLLVKLEKASCRE